MTKTIAAVLDDAVQQLNDRSDSPRLDAEILLGKVLNKSRSYFFTWPEKTLEESDLQAFTALLKERLVGHPIAHLIGCREFWGLEFNVSPHTLIPRPDTELLVEQVLHLKGDVPNLTVVDLGTGTGAIACALGYEKPDWQVTGLELVEDAVSLAKSNVEKLALKNVQIEQSNWFSALEKSARFDVIVSNPPYIDKEDVHLFQGDVRFEPQSALVSAENGLQDIALIAAEAKEHLSSQGLLIVEHGWQQGAQVRQIFTSHGYKKVSTLKDLGNNERVTLGYRPS